MHLGDSKSLLRAKKDARAHADPQGGDDRRFEMAGEKLSSSDERDVCIGQLCFQRPYSSYIPPHFYPRLTHKTHKWKAEATLGTSLQPQLKIGRACILPDCLGLGDNGRWRWQWLPVSVLVGLKAESYLQSKEDSSSSVRACLFPYMCLKSLTPVLGKLALQPLLEVSTVPAAEVQREFSVGHTKFAIRGSIKAANGLAASTSCLQWAIQLQCSSTETDGLRSKLKNKDMTLKYLRKWIVSESCKVVTSATIRMPFMGFQRSFCGEGNSGSVKVIQKLGSRKSRDQPLPVSAYLKASEGFGRSRAISIVPGHWIDPGVENGAPGEREFNLEVASLVEKSLHAHGWEVLRPDRDAPYLSWEGYLNWVSRQTQNGHSVVEIHGQGSTADFRGHIYGVIGDPKITLNKELAKEFGVFDMDWRELGVPRRGGVIIEAFDSDEVLQMDPWQRSEAVRHIASQVVGCVQRARSKSVADELYKTQSS